MFLNVYNFVIELLYNFVSVALDIIYIGIFFYVYHNYIMSKEIKYLQQKIKSQEKYIDDNLKRIGKDIENLCYVCETNYDRIREIIDVLSNIVDKYEYKDKL